jgi:hypothetical protein
VVGEQQTHRADVASSGRVNQRRPEHIVLRVDVRAVRQQLGHHRVTPVITGVGQGRRAPGIARVN